MQPGICHDCATFSGSKSQTKSRVLDETRASGLWPRPHMHIRPEGRGGLSEAKVLWDKLASGCDRGCRCVRTVCASTGEDARHRYLTPGLIMQAVNGCVVMSNPLSRPGGHCFCCTVGLAWLLRGFFREGDNASQSDARNARHPDRMLRNRQSRNPITPKEEESLPRR